MRLLLSLVALASLALAQETFSGSAALDDQMQQAVKDGLIPNMFPEGMNSGVYYTADATLWFFHAVDRYLVHTGDRTLLAHVLPLMVSIIEHHVAGTLFGIQVDERDGLLRQGSPDHPLTWMTSIRHRLHLKRPPSRPTLQSRLTLPRNSTPFIGKSNALATL